MKTIYLSLTASVIMMILLFCNIISAQGTNSTMIEEPDSFVAENKDVTTYTTTPKNLSPPEWPPCCPPIIISQAKIDSPFKLLPDNTTCTSQPAAYLQHGCLTNLVPGRKVECVHFSGNSCVPLHQYVGGTNRDCFGNSTRSSTSSPQWYDIYNMQNRTVQLQYFGVWTTDGKSGWGTKAGTNSVRSIGPHEKCTLEVLAYYPLGIPELKPDTMTIKISYYSDGQWYTAATPQLTDIYNDSRTWQFDGTQWVFAEQNTVPVPEFPFAVPVLLASIMSLIVFGRIKFRK